MDKIIKGFKSFGDCLLSFLCIALIPVINFFCWWFNIGNLGSDSNKKEEKR